MSRSKLVPLSLLVAVPAGLLGVSAHAMNRQAAPAAPAAKAKPYMAFVGTSYPGFTANPRCRGTEILGNGTTFRFARPPQSRSCLGFRPIPLHHGTVPTPVAGGLARLTFALHFFSWPHTIGGMMPDVGKLALRIKIRGRQRTVFALPRAGRYTHQFHELYDLVTSIQSQSSMHLCMGGARTCPPPVVSLSR